MAKKKTEHGTFNTDFCNFLIHGEIDASAYTA